MVAAYVSTLERLVSQRRLQKYRSATKDDLETVVAYLWNVALSESLLQGISAIEVALRNAVHSAFASKAGTDQWFWAILKRNDLRIVNEKWADLSFALKRPPTSGKIIAELSFGFWSYLFETRYAEFWWDQKEAMLHAVFPSLPKGLPPHLKVDRAEIFKRLSLFRDLRNRAMHHEPIMFGIARPDFGSPAPIVSVVGAHAQIVELLGWIDPHWPLTLSFVDRFPDVYQHERQRIEARLNTYFGLM